MKKVAVLPNLELAEVVGRFEELFALCRLWECEDAAGYAREHAADVQALVTSAHLGVPGWVHETMPKLRVIGVYGVGYDGIDIADAAHRGIWVTNTPEVLVDDVADFALALMLAVTRQLIGADAYLRAGRWAKEGEYGLTDRLSEKRVGLLGCGGVGKAIGRRLEPFGCRIGYHTRSRKEHLPWRFFGDVHSLAHWAEILCAAVPGGPATRHLVDSSVLDALGPLGYLINVSRGSVVCEDALVAAVTRGAIAGAALDVFADEPRVPAELVRAKNVVLSPHQASATVVTRTRMGFLVADNIAKVLRGGEPLTPVNRPFPVPRSAVISAPPSGSSDPAATSSAT